MIPSLDPQSTRPYLVRAIYEWCSDHGFTPYVAVQVDDTVQVPREFVRNGEIVLNVSFDATSGLQLGNEYIEFKARFGGISREIMVPLNRVLAIYALENGQGMAFPVAPPAVSAGPVGGAQTGPRSAQQAAATPKKPHLSAVPAPSSSAKVLQLIPGQTAALDEPAAQPNASGQHGSSAANESTPPDQPDPPPNSNRPALKRVK